MSQITNRNQNHFLNFVGQSLKHHVGVAHWPEAELQVRSAFLPGYVANSHVEKVAGHLVNAVSAIGQRAGLLSSQTALLNALLGVPASTQADKSTE